METNQVVENAVITVEKVLYTGDYGYLDDSGYFYFISRRDDMIKRYGEKVSLKAIEEAICFFPSINSVVVIDVPDDMIGAKIIAFVETDAVLQSDNEILQHCKVSLPRSHWPTCIYFLKHLPKNLNGKHDRQALKKSYIQGIFSSENHYYV